MSDWNEWPTSLCLFSNGLFLCLCLRFYVFMATLNPAPCNPAIIRGTCPTLPVDISITPAQVEMLFRCPYFRPPVLNWDSDAEDIESRDGWRATIGLKKADRRCIVIVSRGGATYHMSPYHIYICIYVYREREREICCPSRLEMHHHIYFTKLLGHCWTLQSSKHTPWLVDIGVIDCDHETSFVPCCWGNEHLALCAALVCRRCLLMELGAANE